jgi:putative ABC transport system permease protein
MSVLWYKLRHDLWHHRGRSLLVVLSIAAGVFAVGAIFGMVDQLLSGMDRAHRAVNPAHINIILRNYIPQAVVDELKEVPGVVDVEPVNQLSIRYRLATDDKWALGTLVMRPDFNDQLYDLQMLVDGEWPSDGKFAVERLSGQYFGVDLGESVIFDVAGEERAFEIAGLVRHPFVQPPFFGGQAHFFTDAEGLAEFGIPAGVYGQLFVQVEPYSLEHAQEVAGEIRAWLGARGLGVVVNLYQEPDRHWGRMFVEGVNLVLQIMAVVSLFMSVVLVLNTLTAVITQQTDQIGVIKAIGGRAGVIVRLYLLEVLVYGLLALLIALPSSIIFSFVMSRWFLNLFNIEYQSFEYSWLAVLLSILAALLAPLLAALLPVLRGAAISVREALATYGLGGDFGTNRLDRAIEAFGARLLPTPYAAALGNLFRRKGRLGLSLVVLVTAGVMFLVVMSLIASINLTLDNETDRQVYDVRIGFVENQPEARLRELLATEPQVESIQLWYSRNATLLRAGERMQDSAGLGAQLIGVPPADAMYRPILTAGRWLESDESGRVIVMSEATALKNNIQVGDILTLDLGEIGAATWQVVGLYRVIYGTGFVVEPVYAPLEAVQDVTGRAGEGTQVLVTSNQPGLAQSKDLAERLIAAFEAKGIRIDYYTTTVKLEARAFALNQFSSVTWMLLSLALLVGMVGGIGLMGSLGISVVERRREIGVMRAIGANTRTILSIFIMEGVLQGLISFLIAAPLAYLVSQPLARLLGQVMLEVDLDFAFDFSAVALWLVSVVIIATLASLLPARSAARLSVRASLAY